ncbi:hypothetical protein PVK06_000644 [Gossypium arboreum]|uniref:Uncharacterized protein n=1 Tax=Gossypium arboreum TaxID=29729 RepID=A0ABR0QZW3_GOSAR|nr:hypothetical protein PVK06_000644 [Gossypium arboreum]
MPLKGSPMAETAGRFPSPTSKRSSRRMRAGGGEVVQVEAPRVCCFLVFFLLVVWARVGWVLMGPGYLSKCLRYLISIPASPLEG